MKKYLYVLIPFLKWLVDFILIMLVFGYVMVKPYGLWLDMTVGFGLAAVVAGFFAYWAFHKGVPTDKQLAVFIGCWAVVTFISEATLDFLTLYRPLKILLRWEFLVQTLIEIAVVLAMSRIMKRHQVYH